MKILAMAAFAVLLPVAGLAQGGWGNLDQLLRQSLTRSGTFEASFWLPDNGDPAQATRALGVVYEWIEGSAGSTTIATGLFVRAPDRWVYQGPVEGLFGQSPRDAVFAQGHVDLTTTMLGPNEPRCCPTQATRWRIDLSKLRASQLP